MKTPIVCLFIIFVSLTRCASHLTPTCTLLVEQELALEQLTNIDWKSLTAESVSRSWPTPISWGSPTAGKQPCTGTMTQSYLGEVTANECNCCDTFLFDELAGADGCENALAFISLVRVAPNEAGARRVAEKLLYSVDQNWDRRLRLPVTVTSKRIGTSQTQTTTVAIARYWKGWRIRLTVSRFDRID